MKLPKLTISGTWELNNIARILRLYKEGTLDIKEAIWELIKIAE